MKGASGGAATLTSRHVLNLIRNMNLNSAFNARPRQWGCQLLNRSAKKDLAASWCVIKSQTR